MMARRESSLDDPGGVNWPNNVPQASAVLTASLDRAIPAGSTTSHLFRAAERLRCRPDLVRSTLRALRDQPGRCAELAEHAYWHHNGFVKIKMAETRNFTVRLHIWPAAPNRIGEVDPHNHRWQFASWVAAGAGIVEERFAVVDESDPAGVEYRRYDYGPKPGEEPLRPREFVSLRRKLVLERTSGRVYGCGRKVIHTVAPIGSGLVATVALQGPVKADCADVYRFPGSASTDQQSPVSGKDLADLFACVSDAVEVGQLVDA